jgi:hypothetical protein
MRRVHEVSPALTAPQLAFVFAEEPFPAFVGGYGAGKSQALAVRLLLAKLRHPRLDVGYFAPSFDLIRLIAWPRFTGLLGEWGIGHRLNRSEKVLTLETGGRILFRSMEVPDSIVGFEIADAGIDELDTLRDSHARDAWNRIVARCRQKKPDGSPNSAAVATTPEGFRFVHRLWQADQRPGYRLIRAPTRSNPFLPKGYVDNLKATYPPQLLDAYLEGRFVNLTSGAVYPDFSRVLNHAEAEMRPGESVHAGIDFNVGNCTAIVGLVRDDLPMIVAELTGIRDTPALARLLKERYADRGHAVTLYPDASGAGHRSVNASASDIQILRDHRLAIVAGPANPPVRDRVAALNALILDGEGKRRLRIDTGRCPTLTECLEQQVYGAGGEPDKSAGRDHAPDALGYLIHARWPVVRRRPVSVTPFRI